MPPSLHTSYDWLTVYSTLINDLAMQNFLSRITSSPTRNSVIVPAKTLAEQSANLEMVLMAISGALESSISVLGQAALYVGFALAPCKLDPFKSPFVLV